MFQQYEIAPDRFRNAQAFRGDDMRSQIDRRLDSSLEIQYEDVLGVQFIKQSRIKACPILYPSETTLYRGDLCQNDVLIRHRFFL
jgi:hypothetical protein